MRVTLVHNPTAGDEQHSGDALTAAIEAEEHEVAYQSVKDEEWKRALAAPADLVAVAGGDGTVRKVFRELAGKPVPATLIPLGTANNIARTLGFHTDDPMRLVRGWPSADRRPFDIGGIESPWGQVAFVEATGGGLFAEVLVHAEHENGELDKVRHGLEVLDELLDHAATHPWELDADGDRIAGDFLAVEALNVRETGPNLPLAPDADPGDRVLELVLVRPEDRAALAQHVRARLNGGRGAPLPFERRAVRRMAFSPPADCPLRVDEELWPGDANRRAGAELVVSARWRLDVLVPPV
jgi:diacylglycerol kinase family enzyme